MTGTIERSQRERQARMRYCICGKPIPRPPRQAKERGHREREYCSDKCRQRACRQRNKGKHDLERIKAAMDERMYNAIYQDVHREIWQDELELNNQLIDSLRDELDLTNLQNKILQLDNDLLREQVAAQAAEIARLTALLEGQAKRRRRE